MHRILPIFLILMLTINDALGDCNGIATCSWASWFPWSPCDNTCGSGFKDRWRGVCCSKNKNLGYYDCLKDCNFTVVDAHVTGVPCTDYSKCSTSIQTTITSTVLSSTSTLTPKKTKSVLVTPGTSIQTTFTSNVQSPTSTSTPDKTKSFLGIPVTVLVGGGVGVFTMVIFCCIFFCIMCKKKSREKKLRKQQWRRDML